MAVIETTIGGKTYRLYGQTMYITCSEPKLRDMMTTTMRWIQSRTIGWLLLHSTATFDGDIAINTFTDLADLNAQLDEPLRKVILEVDFELRHAHLDFYYAA